MRHIKEEDEYKPLGRNKGHIDSTKKLIFRTLIISSLNIVDLILSIISFNSECLTYFILKYITITITFLMWFCICSSYSFKKGSTPFGELGYTCFGCIFATVVISLEIAILVFFIKNKNINLHKLFLKCIKIINFEFKVHIIYKIFII